MLYRLMIGITIYFVSLLTYFFCFRNKPATVSVSSELPLGSGLGSSAAFCVSLSGALLALSDSSKVDFSQQDWVSFGEKDQLLANKWAFEGEKIIHGKPSGIDNTVSTYGMSSLTINVS